MQIRYNQRKMTPFNKCDHKNFSRMQQREQKERKSKSDRRI